MEPRQQYIAFKEIADIAISCGGKVFGGFVRDFVRKEHFCSEFFRNHKKEDFTNKDVSPHTLDRLLIPKDLDIHFTKKEDYVVFRQKLKASFYRSSVSSIDNIYARGIPGVHHIKLEAVIDLDVGRVLSSLKIPRGVAQEIIKPQLVERLEGMEIQSTPISIDVLISQSEPPFTDLDFECNGLVMTKDGVHLCEDLKKGLTPFGVHRIFTRIVDHIKNKTAVVVNLKGTRWDKMSDKGWDLVGAAVEKVNKSGEECLICLQEIQPDEVHKLNCCNAYYHFACLSTQITYPDRGIVDSGKCTHCRQPFDMSYNEVQVFGALIGNY